MATVSSLTSSTTAVPHDAAASAHRINSEMAFSHSDRGNLSPSGRSPVRWGVLGALLLLMLCVHAPQASDAEAPPKQTWSFQSPIGTFDRGALQRGFQVYKQVCSVCHGVSQLAFRNLKALGFNDEEIKALAAEYKVKDGPNDEGEMYERSALPSDDFVGPYANDQQARNANNGALPPDLSLIVKARLHGPDYIYALLTGYREPPSDLKISEGMYYNAYFPGAQIAMPAPLSEGMVTFADGTSATIEQMAKDVTTFLAWTSEPELEERHRIGFRVMLFLSVFTILMYAVMRRVWRDVS